jgi:DNA (cytosine-5)-methyltransferase 1
MIENVNLFDGHIPYYKITKPVRLIELFAGIGSQHQALKNLGVKIDRSTIVEWQVNSFQAYNDIHIRKYDDWTQGITKEELAYRLNQLGVSIDYNEPVKLESLMRKGEDWLRNVYNNIINTNNKVNIMSVKGSHLNITETDKYDYILTYSFPCQDLSKAGKGKGMSDTNTRSGLLWEVERILSECDELPQVLLMENVPDVIGSRYISDFKRWDERLRELGYSNHIEVLNAKNYGIPQNRERAFMVSILGSSLYRFPQKQPLKLRLKDMLEKEVDEKYYLSKTFIEAMNKPSKGFNRAERFEQSTHKDLDGIAFTITSKAGSRPTDNFIEEDLFKSKDKRLPEMLDKIDYNSTEPQSLDLYNRTVSDISQTLTLPNHNAQAIAVKEPKVDVIANINPNGTSQSCNVYDKEQLSPTLCASDYKSPPKITEPSLVIPEDTILGYALAHEGDGVYTNRPEQKRGVVQKQMIQTIKANSNDLGVVVNDDSLIINPLKDKTQYGWHFEQNVYDDKGITRALKASEGSGNIPKVVKNNLRIRKLTPRECYRLMGFGDQAFELAQPNQSNSSLYHQAGDSIVVNVLEAIFRSLL